MPHLEYFLVCESVSVDQETNQISLFNVLEGAQGRSFPVHIIKLAAVSAWNREPGEEDTDHQVVLRVQVPGEEQVRDMRVNIRLSQPRHRVIHRIENIRINQPGDLIFKILINEETRAHHVITISEVRS